MASVSETETAGGVLSALEWSYTHLYVAAVTLVAGVLRGHTLASRPTPTDEAIVLSIVQRWSLVEIATLVPQGQPHWPTYFVMMDLWLELVGVSELAGRLPSVVFGVATVPVMFLLGRRLYDDRVGLLAATFVALSPMHVEVSQIIRMYALLGFVTAVSWLLLVRLRDRPCRRRAGHYLVGAACLAYTHYYGFLLVGAQALYLTIAPYYHPGFRMFRRRVLGGIAAIVTPGTVWILHRLMQRGGGKPLYRTWREAPPDGNEIIRFAVQYVIGTPAATQFGPVSRKVLGAVAVSAAAVYLCRRCREWSDSEYLLVLWVIVPTAVALGVSELVKPMVRPRYFVGVFGIGGLLAAAVGVAHWRPRRATLGAVAISIAMIGGLVPYYAMAGGPWEDAGEYVNEHADQGDELATVGMYPGEVQWHTQSIDAEHVASAKTLNRLDVDASGDVWLIASDNGVFRESSEADAAAAGLGEEYKVTKAHESGRLTVYHISNSSASNS